MAMASRIHRSCADDVPEPNRHDAMASVFHIMSDDNELVGPFTRKALRGKLLEAYAYGANPWADPAENAWADADIDALVAEAPKQLQPDEQKPASAIPTPTPRLDRIVEGVVLSDVHAPDAGEAVQRCGESRQYGDIVATCSRLIRHNGRTPNYVDHVDYEKNIRWSTYRIRRSEAD
jgi:hypothetical protein